MAESVVADVRETGQPREAAAPDLGSVGRGDFLLASEEIERALGQTLADALDLGRWGDRGDLRSLLTCVNDAVGRSVDEERRVGEAVRHRVLPLLQRLAAAPECAGVYEVPTQRLRDARRAVLMSGNLTAVDGACAGHDGLAAMLVCVGVGLVRYDGAANSWRALFLRRDYDAKVGDIERDMLAVLNRRAERSEEGPAARRDQLSSLLRRGVMAAAERKALLEHGTTRWRMGDGSPAPLELLTGSGSMDLIDESLPVLEALLLNETRWVFLPDGLANRAYLTLAAALRPGELAVFQSTGPTLEWMVSRGTYDAARKRRVQAFAARAGGAMVIGGFRATDHAPPRLFVAHAERAVEAGVIAMADAALQPHKGAPLILDIAQLTAKSGVALEAFGGMVEAAYARRGGPGLYHPGAGH